MQYFLPGLGLGFILGGLAIIGVVIFKFSRWKEDCKKYRAEK